MLALLHTLFAYVCDRAVQGTLILLGMGGSSASSVHLIIKAMTA